MNELGSTNAMTDSVLRRLRPVLAESLTPDQLEWALQAYRERILPSRLSVSLDSVEQQQRWAERIADGIIEELRHVPPDRRWATVQAAAFLEQLSPLNQRAQTLARQAHAATAVDGAAVDSADATEAETIKRGIEALASEVRQSAPEAYELLRPEISEALLDCEYAMHRTPYQSLRLGRWAGGRSATPAAPAVPSGRELDASQVEPSATSPVDTAEEMQLPAAVEQHVRELRAFAITVEQAGRADPEAVPRAALDHFAANPGHLAALSLDDWQAVRHACQLMHDLYGPGAVPQALEELLRR